MAEQEGERLSPLDQHDVDGVGHVLAGQDRGERLLEGRVGLAREPEIHPLEIDRSAQLLDEGALEGVLWADHRGRAGVVGEDHEHRWTPGSPLGESPRGCADRQPQGEGGRKWGGTTPAEDRHGHLLERGGYHARPSASRPVSPHPRPARGPCYFAAPSSATGGSESRQVGHVGGLVAQLKLPKQVMTIPIRRN